MPKYKKKANKGDAKSQYKLGICYYNGYGVDKDISEAIKWFRKAAEQNDAEAEHFLGNLYRNGKGVEQDEEQALYWYERAESHGSLLATLSINAIKEEKKQSASQQNTIIKQSQVSDPNTETIQEPKFLSDVDQNIPNTSTSDHNTFAIVIGNEKYKNVAEVPFAVKDAKVFGEYLEKTLGVPHEQIKLLENATFNDIRIAVNWLSQAMAVCEGKGKAIDYYAGHGIPNESDNSSYLLPVDGIGSDPASAYSLKDFYDKLGNMQAQSVTVFLDACFSGTKRDNGMLVAARGVAIKVKPSAPKGKMVVFSAAQGDETAYPYRDMQHGLFTYFLLKKLQETKGNVTLGELGDYLKSEVKRQSFLKNNKVQTPMISVATALQNQWKTIKL